MRTLFFAFVIGLIGFCQAQAAEMSWTGSWDTRWRDGGARMNLQETGGKVTGDYPAYGGHIEGDIQGRSLKGRWIEGPRSGGLEFILAPDGQSFMGRFDNGEWWTGGRVSASSNDMLIDQSGARQALRTLVDAGNAARDGSPDAMTQAVAVLDFGAVDATIIPGEKLAAAKALFELVDLTTFHLWTIPGKRAQGDHIDLTLAQAGTNATLPLSLVKKGEQWFILNPAPDVLADARKALLARSGGHLPAPEDYRHRHSARDAMRSFVGGFSDWEGQGRAQSLDALDLSDLSEAVRDYEGELAAQYLKEVIDRVGAVVPQEIPDDPVSREAYVFFSHPEGNIVVSAVGSGDQLSWKLSADTVRTARDLYIAVEDMPTQSGMSQPTPVSTYFQLRRWIRDHAAPLLGTVGILELWQAVGWVLILLISSALAVALGSLILIALRRLIGGTRDVAEREIRWPLWIALTFSIYKLLIPVIGLPELLKRISVGTTGVLLALALMWGGWRLVDLIGDVFFRRPESSLATMDNIVVSLAFGALKLALLAGGFVFIAIELSLPYEGLLAGLSIGGLAVAFASKETISNVFGAGILAIDRPFRRGDWIIAGENQGTVESVGIRSTRIRTGQDSLVIVPNGKLSDATVNNLGTRRYHVTKATVPVSYAATVAQLESFTKGLKDLISGLPQAVPQRTEVNVMALGREKIEIEYTVCLEGKTVTDEASALSNLKFDILRLAEHLNVKIGEQLTNLT